MILENLPTTLIDNIKAHCGHKISLKKMGDSIIVRCDDCYVEDNGEETVGKNDKAMFVFPNLPKDGIDQAMSHSKHDLSMLEYPYGAIVIACEDCDEVLIEFSDFEYE